MELRCRAQPQLPAGGDKRFGLLPSRPVLPAAQNISAGLSCRSNAIDDSTAKNAARGPLAFNLRSFTDRVSKEEAASTKSPKEN